jgi:isopenicillin-N N-acyltransferase-like protein
LVEPAPLIDVAGSPHARGVQHGRLARERILRGTRHYGEQLQKLGLSESGLEKLVAGYRPIIESFDPTYIEEMRGIAEGAGVPFTHIVLLNARTEILKAAQRDAPDTADGCTTVVALPKATKDGRLIHAHNWDWKLECVETSIVLRIRRDDGPDILTFTEAGALARFGVNAAGIGLSANYLESDRDYRTRGIPLALLRRKVLEQEHYAMALRAVYITPKSASNNITVTHASGTVCNLECAPDESFVLDPEGDLLVHGNRWLSPIALTKLRETGIAAIPCSLYRDKRARELLAPKCGEITLRDIESTMFDEAFSPWSILRPQRPNMLNDLTATVATLIMRPDEGVMDVAMHPAEDRRFTRYTLGAAEAASRRPHSIGMGD